MPWLDVLTSVINFPVEESKIIKDNGRSSQYLNNEKKPPSKSWSISFLYFIRKELIGKIKYKLQDEKLKLVSIDPKDILGANELWIYNTKNRKIGKYFASNIDPKGMGRDGTGLSIKGTTITGFDEKLSIQKTLRKPEDSLKAFKSAGKVALRKFLDELTTTDTKLVTVGSKEMWVSTTSLFLFPMRLWYKITQPPFFTNR